MARWTTPGPEVSTTTSAFTDTVEGTRHKGIIFYCIGKDYELPGPIDSLGCLL